MRAAGYLAATAALTGVAGAAALMYGNAVGAKRFTLRHHRLGLLPAGALPLRILHISDIHYVPGQARKRAWLQSLARVEPDLVVNTGDNLSHREAVPEVLDALGPLLEFPGVFVPGSNDYYAPRLKNPLGYFRGPSSVDPEREELPWRELFTAFGTSGWVNLANRHQAMVINERQVQFSGVDDPHIGLDHFTGWPHGAPPRAEAARRALRIGVAHAPVSHVLNQFASAGADLILAGHTHGGQICLPGGRALVTNCDLPVAHARGISAVTTPAGVSSVLHVSAGIGASAKAPVRLNCVPEATIVDLVQHQT